MTQEKDFTLPKDDPKPSSAPERDDNRVISFIKNLMKPKIEVATLRETLEGFVDESPAENTEQSITTHEKVLIANILNVRDLTAADVMVPRADIVSISASSTQEELFALLAEKQYSRLPVYTETLDDVIGSIHAKDILAALARGERIILRSLVRDVPIISPAMHILDLLLQMRMTRKHMALVVDEFGGIDGLITIGDVIEAIVGEIYDEHDPDDEAELVEKSDGTIIANARFSVDEFEKLFGNILSEDERSENDTIGGLVIYMAGRVPARGEVLTHSSGMIFEIIDADPRRVNRLCIGNIPKNNDAE